MSQYTLFLNLLINETYCFSWDLQIKVNFIFQQGSINFFHVLLENYFYQNKRNKHFQDRMSFLNML